ncbi:cupin-like domain-containing protein [Hephaestia sp. GCM10023244]|uniref:cupin-like domain-containing protein n=1 Tax=unclassified Hephaestia TaxID=2631281 RepID=UPI0020770FA1|nr:cupin-like domain-containing protein [Hephaestia sp. MAHUQ-44]MCM8730222.1 cupin-like domain-containing protein [Hephaestia sp. MAHUQ-44]
MTTSVADGQQASPPIREVDDVLRRAIAELILDGAADEPLARMLSDAAAIPVDVIAREIAIARQSPYLIGAHRLQRRLQKWSWVLQNRARLYAGTANGLAVPTVAAIAPARFYSELYIGHRPAVIRGLVDHWPARDKWSLDSIAETLGDQPVQLQWDRSRDPSYESNSNRHRASKPFSAVAARLRSTEPSNDFYVTANNSGENREVFAPLFEDVGEIPGILKPGGAREGFFWIGPRGTITPWHHDLTNNLLVQFVGRKRVRLVASHDTPLMRNHLHCYSLWGSDDLPPGPAAGDKPAVLECTIGPGDALFLPVGWWHHVEGLDQTIGMSFTSFAWNNDFYSSYRSHGSL